MQEGRIVDSFIVEGTETRFRYPRWRDLDAFIAMHGTLTREKVMCRRLELDAASGGRELSQALVGLKQKRSSYLLVEQDGVMLGEGFTQKSGHDYCTIGLALIARARGIGIGNPPDASPGRTNPAGSAHAGCTSPSGPPMSPRSKSTAKSATSNPAAARTGY